MADDPSRWQPVKDAAVNLKDALNTAVHKSPADVAHDVASGTQVIVHGTLNSLDHFINWLDTKV